MIRPIASVLCLCFLSTFFPAGGAPVPVEPAPPGPGKVLEMHERLFAALDRGDTSAVKGLLTESPRGASWDADGWHPPAGFLVYGQSREGAPFEALTEQDGLKTLVAWASKDGDADSAWKTTIRKAWSDCSSREMSFLCMEFERERPSGDGVELVRYRSTSLVSHGPGGWRLWHFHVSRV